MLIKQSLFANNVLGVQQLEQMEKVIINDISNIQNKVTQLFDNYKFDIHQYIEKSKDNLMLNFDPRQYLKSSIEKIQKIKVQSDNFPQIVQSIIFLYSCKDQPQGLNQGMSDQLKDNLQGQNTKLVCQLQDTYNSIEQIMDSLQLFIKKETKQIPLLFEKSNLLSQTIKDIELKNQFSEIDNTYTVIENHQDWVSSICFSPNGEYFASASWDKTIKLWNATSLELLGSFQEHKDWISQIQFSKDSRLLASAGYDDQVKILSLDTFQNICSFQVAQTNFRSGQQGQWSVCFANKSSELISGGANKLIYIWDHKGQKQLGVLKGHDSFISQVKYSSNDAFIASSSFDKTVRIWNPFDFKCLHVFKGHLQSVLSLDISKDNQWIISSGSDQSIRLWSIENREKNVIIDQAHQSDITCVSFSKDQFKFLSASNDQKVKIWDFQQLICQRTLQGHSNIVMSAQFSPDTKRVISSGRDKTIKIWNF